MMDALSYTFYTASLYIDGVRKEYQSHKRQAVADWLTDIMQKAGAVDLPITSPKITTQIVSIRKGQDWKRYELFERSQPVVYSGASNDPAILDWHPEWSKE